MKIFHPKATPTFYIGISQDITYAYFIPYEDLHIVKDV